MQGKKAMIKSSPPHLVKNRRFAVVRVFYCLEDIFLVVGLSEVILDIIILCRNTQLDKLILEGAGLFKEAMHFAVYCHIQTLLLEKFYT